MAFVVGILLPGDHGLGRAYAVGQLRLGKAGVLAKPVNLVRDFTIGDFLLETLLALRVVAGDVGQNLQSVSAGFLRHRRFLF